MQDVFQLKRILHGGLLYQLLAESFFHIFKIYRKAWQQKLIPYKTGNRRPLYVSTREKLFPKEFLHVKWNKASAYTS